MSVPISWFTTTDAMLKNVGSISNQGVEFEIHAHDILNSEQVQWNSDFTLTTLKAKVEKLPNGEFKGGHGDFYLFKEGEDLYTWYLPTYNGVNQDTGLAEFLIDPSKPATPDNLTVYYSEAGLTTQGSGYAKLNGGWNNSISYKGFTLSALLTYQFGGKFFDYGGYFMQHDGLRFWGFMPAKKVVGNYWKQKGDQVKYPRPSWDASGSLRSDKFSSRTLFSSDFIRLKELSVAYELPKVWISKIGISNARLSFGVTNVAFLYAGTKDEELEVSLNGYRPTDTPLPRTYTFGLNFSF